MAVAGCSKYIVFIKIWRIYCMFSSPLISGIYKSTVKNEDGSFSQPCTFKKEFYLHRLFKRILKLQAFKSRRYFHLFSLQSFSLKSKLYPVSTVSGLDAHGAIRVQSYGRHRSSLWAALRNNPKYTALDSQSWWGRYGCRQAPCKRWLSTLRSGSCWFLWELGVQDRALKAPFKGQGELETSLEDAPKQEPNLVVLKPLCKSPPCPGLSLDFRRS